MEPSPTEVKASKAVREKLQALADMAVSKSDILREYLLDPSSVHVLPHVNFDMEGDLDRLNTENNRNYSKVATKHFDSTKALTNRYLELNDMVTSGEPLPDDERDKIYAEQVSHRKDDMVRLLQHFLDERDFKKVVLVSSCDPAKPLEPQLGFSPDDY